MQKKPMVTVINLNNIINIATFIKKKKLWIRDMLVVQAVGTNWALMQ